MATTHASPARRWRIAVAGLGCENCTFNPMLTTLEDFHPELDTDALADK
jgi:microcystin degradation protein MlrC